MYVLAALIVTDKVLGSWGYSSSRGLYCQGSEWNGSLYSIRNKVNCKLLRK